MQGSRSPLEPSVKHCWMFDQMVVFVEKIRAGTMIAREGKMARMQHLCGGR